MKVRFFILFIFMCGSLSSEAYNPKFESDNYFRLKTYEKKELEKFAYQWATKFDLDKAVILSVIFQESRWRHTDTSSAEAKGLMQLLTPTAKDMGMSDKESLYNPYTNIYYGCKYLRWLLDRYEGDYELTLVGYYAGPKRADYLRDGKLKHGSFRQEIIGYAVSVLSRSENMEVYLDQKVEAEEINKL